LLLLCGKIISSRYAQKLFPKRGKGIWFMKRWNIAGVLHKPNGITFYEEFPRGVGNVVNISLFFAIYNWL
jgi:hypothetical protein